MHLIFVAKHFFASDLETLHIYTVKLSFVFF